MLFYAILHSTILLLINFFLISYTLLRLIRALLVKNNLQSEIEEFNSFVCQSRKSLDYVSTNVQVAVKEIENDLARELQITHHFTQFEDRLSLVLKRFAKLQDEALEYLRMHPNMRSIQIETPQNIHEEVKEILAKMKSESKPLSEASEQTKSTVSKKSLNKPNPIKKFISEKKSAGDHPAQDLSPLHRRMTLSTKNKERAPTADKRYFPNFKIVVSQNSSNKLAEPVKHSGFNQSWVVHE